MEGGDMIEVEVYKAKEKRWKRGSREKHKKEISTKARSKERVKSVNIYTNLSFSDELSEGEIPPLFYKINLFFSIEILGQSPLLLFVSLFYKFY